MKRKILEITEIDCGDETCEGCVYLPASGRGYECERFKDEFSESPGGGEWNIPPRLPECLGAERRYKDVRSVVPFRGEEKAQGPPDSIGE